MTTWSASTILNVVVVRNVSGIHSREDHQDQGQQVEHARLAAGRAATLVMERRCRVPVLVWSPGPDVLAADGSSWISSIRSLVISAPCSSAMTTPRCRTIDARAQALELGAVRRAHHAWRCPRMRRQVDRGGGCRPWSRRRRPGSARRARAPAARSGTSGPSRPSAGCRRTAGRSAPRACGGRTSSALDPLLGLGLLRRGAQPAAGPERAQVADAQVLAHGVHAEQRRRSVGRRAPRTGRRRSRARGRNWRDHLAVDARPRRRAGGGRTAGWPARRGRTR